MKWLVAFVLAFAIGAGTAVAVASDGGEPAPVVTTDGAKLGPATVVFPDGGCLTVMPPASTPEAC